MSVYDLPHDHIDLMVTPVSTGDLMAVPFSFPGIPGEVELIARYSPDPVGRPQRAASAIGQNLLRTNVEAVATASSLRHDDPAALAMLTSVATYQHVPVDVARHTVPQAGVSPSTLLLTAIATYEAQCHPLRTYWGSESWAYCRALEAHAILHLPGMMASADIADPFTRPATVVPQRQPSGSPRG